MKAFVKENTSGAESPCYFLVLDRAAGEMNVVAINRGVLTSRLLTALPRGKTEEREAMVYLDSNPELEQSVDVEPLSVKICPGRGIGAVVEHGLYEFQTERYRVIITDGSSPWQMLNFE